jgi:cobalt-zinc-cadmium efflux system outer membrane protein
MRRFLPFLMWAALLPLSSFAQGTASSSEPVAIRVSLTLGQAREAALARHPDLLAAAREVEASEAAQQQAGARPNPTLGVEVEDARRSTRATTVQLSQAIERGGKRSARVQVAQSAREVALADLIARRADIRSAVTSAFFDVLIAQERQRLAEASLQLAQRGSRAVANRVIAGKVSAIEETRAKVAEAGVRIEVVTAGGELAMARQRLASAMGDFAVTVSTLEGAPSELPASVDDAHIEQGLLQAPAALRARAAVARAAALVDLERSRQTPDVTVSIGAKRDGETQRQMAIVGVSIPLPVFDTNRGAVLEAQRRHDKARDELAAAQLRVRTEARVTAQQLRTARAEVEALQRDGLPGSQRAYDATTAGYELGKFGLLDVLDAQRSLLQAKTQHLQALANAHRAAVELERWIGAPAIHTTDTK